jgi:hypothetical protein
VNQEMNYLAINVFVLAGHQFKKASLSPNQGNFK